MRTSFGMRTTFFERGLRGKPPGALIRHLNRSCYEGQFAGYLQYLDVNQRDARPRTNADDYQIPTTRGDRLVAGIIAAGCLICASFVADHLALPDGPEMGWDIHTVIFHVLFGLLLGFFMVLGYVCLRVVFAKE